MTEKRYNIKPFTETVDESTRLALEAMCPNKKVLLYFSTGKDSVAAWLTLREMNFEVVPIFEEIIPELSIFRAPIKAYEEYFGTEVFIAPSAKQFKDLYAVYGNQQEQNTIPLLDYAARIKKITRKREMTDWLLKKYNCDLAIIGTKASDGLNRRIHFIMHGPYNAKRRTFALVWRLANKAPWKLMIDAKCPIPRYYLWSACSPEFIFNSEFYFIQKYLPEDWKKILEYLPDADIKAYKFAHSKNNRIVPVSKLLLEQYKITPELFI